MLDSMSRTKSQNRLLIGLVSLLSNLLLASPSARAIENEEWEIGVVQGTTPENCRTALAEAFKSQG